MITGGDTSSDLKIDFGFRIGCPSNPFQDMVGPLGTGIGLRQVKRRSTAIQSSQMGLKCERTPLYVRITS